MAPFFSSSMPPSQITFSVDDLSKDLSLGEQRAALAREVSTLRIYSQKKDATLSMSSIAVRNLSGQYPRIGPWNRQARLEALSLALANLRDKKISEVCLLTLLEQERSRSEMNGAGWIQDIAGLSLTDLVGFVRHDLQQRGVPIDRSRASVYFRVRATEAASGVTFSILKKTIFVVPPESVKSLPDAIQRLDAYFDRSPELSQLRCSGSALFLSDKVLLSFTGHNGMLLAQRATKSLTEIALDYRWQVR